MQKNFLTSYEEYRHNKGISENTTYIETLLIKKLIAYINFQHKKIVEPKFYVPKDIKLFIENERQSGIKESTLRRKIHMIKLWFDYLYKKDDIPFDFMAKYEYKATPIKKKDIHLSYSELLEKKSFLLESNTVSIYGKMIFLLYMNAVRLKDLVNINLNQIHTTGSVSTIRIQKKGFEQVFQLRDLEVSILQQCINRAKERQSGFLLSSKVDGEYVALSYGSIKDFVTQINNELDLKFRSEDVRLAYVNYLYKTKKKSTEDIQKVLGTSLQSTALTIEMSIERVKDLDYNIN